MDTLPSTEPELSCRITRTLLMYVREENNGSLGNLLEGLELDESYLMDDNNWISHDFMQTLYRRMISGKKRCPRTHIQEHIICIAFGNISQHKLPCLTHRLLLKIFH